MRNSKRGLRALVLAIMAAVLGTMAVAATGAQAQHKDYVFTHEETLHLEKLHNEVLHQEKLHSENKAILNPEPLASNATNTLGQFLINLGKVESSVNVGASQIGEGSLLVPGRNLTIKCKKLDLNEGKITSSTHAQGAATFLGCITFAHSDLKQLPCLFVEPLTVKASTLVLPILHGPAANRENFLLFEPKAGEENFTVVEFQEKTECPLPLVNPVKGAVSALVHALDAVSQLILFSKEIQELTGDVLRYGGFPSSITAHGLLEALAPHAGQKLGIH